VVLKVDGLEVAYGRIRVLDGVDLHVGEAEIVALLGTNGAGKSTVLKAISGILPILGGKVTVAGKDLTGAAPETVLAAGVGHVPGGRGLLADLTVEENLLLGGHTLPRSDLDDAIQAASSHFGWMSQRSGQLAGTLSGGEQQMLAIARALVPSPRILMVDELSLGLAPVVVEELLELVRQLVAEDGISVLLVEQHATLALSVCDRAYFLERGRVRYQGPAEDLRGRDDLLRSVFLEGTAADRRSSAIQGLSRRSHQQH
jgi:branched-chain amino acid transport system ATP-binding protein